MRKIYNFYALMFCVLTLSAQSGTKDYNLIYPSAPSTNNLMKYEEVPVSYYTGVPDINIPLFNIPSINKDINLNVALKYHTLSNKPDDKASEVGLGWSLMAGGTITRTIRGGLADEKISSLSGGLPGENIKYGIYHSIHNPTAKILNHTILPSNEYLFYASKGRYDSDYDLYQYNFMGHSGRFTVKLNDNGTFGVEMLEKTNIRIECNIDDTSKAPVSFQITDDKGIIYVFYPKEESSKSISNTKIGITDNQSPVSSHNSGVYTSAFQLTQVKDQSDKELIRFNYTVNSTYRYLDPPTKTSRIISEKSSSGQIENTGQSVDSYLPGKFEMQTVTNEVNTNLLSSIDIIGIGTINLEYSSQRTDSSYDAQYQPLKLISIYSNIYDSNDKLQSKERYSFDYVYTATNFSHRDESQIATLTKMVLKTITKENGLNEIYEMDYYPPIGTNTLKCDDWGFFKRDTYTDVIRSITYPTKGRVVYGFEENEYSYVQGRDEDMDAETAKPIIKVTGHYEEVSENAGVQDPILNEMQPFFTIDRKQTVNIFSYYGDLVNYSWRYRIYKDDVEVAYVGHARQVFPPGGPNQNPNDDPTEIITEKWITLELEPGTYYGKLEIDQTSNSPFLISSSFLAYYTNKVFVSETKRKGGGFRIKSMEFYDNNQSTAPLKKVVYGYDDIIDNTRSSGALSYPEPLFD